MTADRFAVALTDKQGEADMNLSRDYPEQRVNMPASSW
jgi:hypothetical protein